MSPLMKFRESIYSMPYFGAIFLSFGFGVCTHIVGVQKPLEAFILLVSMASFVLLLEPWKRTDEWKLHLPISTRTLLFDRLATVGARLIVAMVLYVGFGLLIGKIPPQTLTITAGTLIFLGLSYLLLMRIPSPGQTDLRMAWILPPLFVIAGYLLLLKKLPRIPLWELPASACLFAILLIVNYLRVPVSFLLARDAADAEPSWMSSATGRKENGWRLLGRGEVLASMLSLALLGWACAFHSSLVAPSIMFIGFYFQFSKTFWFWETRAIEHLPWPRRLTFAALVAPMAVTVLVCSLSAVFFQPGPVANPIGRFRFGHATHQDYRGPNEYPIWPTSWAVFNCEKIGPVDLRLVNSDLSTCYGFAPEIGLERYVGSWGIEWEKFWKEHPSTPRDFEFRVIDTARNMFFLFALAGAGCAMRITLRSRHRILNSLLRYRPAAFWTIYGLIIAGPFAWFELGNLVRSWGAAIGAVFLENAALNVAAEMLPANPILSVTMLLAFVAMLYIAVQELYLLTDSG